MPISMPFNMQPRNVCAAVFTMFLIELLFFVRVMVFHVSCQSSTSMRTFAIMIVSCMCGTFRILFSGLFLCCLVVFCRFLCLLSDR